MKSTRDRIHQLVDEVPEGDLATVALLLTERHATADPFLRALANAPEDDESLTPEEQDAVQEGLDAIARGEVISASELRRTIDR
ncbi:MAG: hypothetical protein H0W06_10350 [Chloroflexia bacterium]|nr:hypothetical protein [Chloroflexia bacterium]